MKVYGLNTFTENLAESIIYTILIKNESTFSKFSSYIPNQKLHWHYVENIEFKN